MDLRAILARNLTDLMEKSADLSSQLALAKRSGVAQSSINRILRRQTGASIDTVEALAEAFGVSPWQLLHPNPELQAAEADFYARMRRLLAESGPAK